MAVRSLLKKSQSRPKKKGNYQNEKPRARENDSIRQGTKGSHLEDLGGGFAAGWRKTKTTSSVRVPPWPAKKGSAV